MKVTAATITDYQIRELRESIRNGTAQTADPRLWAACTNAPAGFEECRADCVEAWNARHRAKP